MENIWLWMRLGLVTRASHYKVGKTMQWRSNFIQIQYKNSCLICSIFLINRHWFFSGLVELVLSGLKLSKSSFDEIESSLVLAEWFLISPDKVGREHPWAVGGSRDKAASFGAT